MTDKIRYRSLADAAGWTEANNLVLRDLNLSDGAFRTYLHLRNYARQDGNAFPRQEALMRERGCSKRTIQMHLSELQTRGLIEVERRGLGMSNIYWLNSLDAVYRRESDGSSGVNVSDSKAQNSAHQDRKRRILHEVAQNSAHQEVQESAHPIKRIEKQADKENTTKNKAADVVVSPCVDELVGIGITRSVAVDLVLKHSAEEIMQQIEWLPYRGAKDGPAVLVKAIVNNWTAPVAFLAAKKAKIDRDKAAAERARRKREMEQLQEESEAEEARADELWALMTPAERERIEALVMTELEGLKGIPRGGMVWQSLIGSKRREILRARLDDPFRD